MEALSGDYSLGRGQRRIVLSLFLVTKMKENDLMPVRFGLMALLLSASSAYGIDLRYWIEPCTRAETACQGSDVQLAEWAVQAWQAASDGKLHL